MKVEIKEIQKVALNNPIIIEGFPGVGMIGTISSAYLAEKLGMTLIGYFSSPQFPPVAAIHNFKPMTPMRIYASEKYNLIILFSELVIPADAVFSLASAVIDFSKKHNTKMIYSLAGIASQTPDNKIYGIPSNDSVAQQLRDKSIELIKEGATQGVSGVLIAECAVQKIPAANLMVQTAAPLDPKAAARLLDKLADVIGTKIDTAELVNDAQKMESKIKDTMEKMKALHKDYKGMEDNPMYA